MKPLILSFFAVIFVYSFFFDKKERVVEPTPNVIQSIHKNTIDSIHAADSAVVLMADYYWGK